MFEIERDSRSRFYRYEDYREGAGYVDICGDFIMTGTNVKLALRSYPVLRTTAKGVWIDMAWEGEKFILLRARKKFACATKEEALESFLARKERQVSILSRQLKNAQKALQLGKEMSHEEM